MKKIVVRSKVDSDVKDFLRELFFGNKLPYEMISDAVILAEKSDEIKELDFIQILINCVDGMEVECVDEAERFAIAYLLEVA